MEDKKRKHHHEEEHKHHHHHHHHPEHPECPPIGNPDCEGHTKGEKVLTESGLKAIIQKLTGRLMLAVGVVKAKGDAPLKLWKEVDGDGILIRGMMTPVSESTDGWFSKEDYQRFLQALTDIETIFKRLANIDATLEGLANSITSIRAELAEIQTHLTTLDGEIVSINTRIDELTTLVNNLDVKVTELNTLIEEVQDTLGDCLNSITASGDDCLTLSASKSGQTATVTGSVQSATTTQRGAMTATDKSRLDELWQKYQNGDFGCDCTHYTYSDITVSLSYSTASASATSLSPSMSYSQTVTGSDGSSTTLTSGATVVYSLSNAASGVTINSSTGVLSFSANTSTTQRTLGTVTVSVSMNEKTTTRSVTVYQAAASPTYTYSTPVVSLSYSTASATATSLTPTCTYTQTRTGSDGSSTTITSGGSLSYSLSNAASGVTINSSNGTLSFSANTTTSQITLGTVTVTVTLNGETGTATTTAYQAAGEGGGTGEVTYEYSTPSVTLTYTDVPANGGTATPTCTYTQTRTGSDGSTATITSGGSLSYSKIDSGNGDWQLDGSTGVITKSSENSSDQRDHLGEVRVTVALNGKTGTADCWVYQEAGESTEVTYTYSDPVISVDQVSQDLDGNKIDGQWGMWYNKSCQLTVHYQQTKTGSNGSSETIRDTGGAVSVSAQNLADTVTISQTSENNVFDMTCEDTNPTPYRRSLARLTITVTANDKTATSTIVLVQSPREVPLFQSCDTELGGASGLSLDVTGVASGYITSQLSDIFRSSYYTLTSMTITKTGGSTRSLTYYEAGATDTNRMAVITLDNINVPTDENGDSYIISAAYTLISPTDSNYTSDGATSYSENIWTLGVTLQSNRQFLRLYRHSDGQQLLSVQAN